MKVRTPISGASACRGFTLLELLLVCALMLLAAGLVAAYLAGGDQKEFTRDLRQISSLIVNARRLAIVTGSEQTVRLATVTREESTESDERTDDDATNDGASALNRPDLLDWLNPNSKLRFAATIDEIPEEADELEIRFFPMGSSSGGLIGLEAGDREAWFYIYPLTGELLLEPEIDDIEAALAESRP